MEIFRFIAGAVFILAGLVVACIAVIGNYKFKFVLNRMHAAALNDTLGILFVLFGLIILNGWNFTSLKMFVFFGWRVLWHHICLHVWRLQQINSR